MGLTRWRRAGGVAACGAAAAVDSAAVVCEGDTDAFCADTTPKAARPRIIKAATMLMVKRTVSSSFSTLRAVNQTHMCSSHKYYYFQFAWSSQRRLHRSRG